MNAGDSALAIVAKVVDGNEDEMDVAAALIYEGALPTGTNDLGGDHAAVSQYLFDKYIATEPGDNAPPTVTPENVSTTPIGETDATVATKVADIVVDDPTVGSTSDDQAAVSVNVAEAVGGPD